MRLGWGGRSWEIKQLLYADDAGLVPETREYLQYTLKEFERACDGMEAEN